MQLVWNIWKQGVTVQWNNSSFLKCFIKVGDYRSYAVGQLEFYQGFGYFLIGLHRLQADDAFRELAEARVAKSQSIVMKTGEESLEELHFEPFGLLFS